MSSRTRRFATAALLLLALPWTLAPRTSWTLDSVMYDLAPASPRDTVRPRAGVPLNLQINSRSDDPIVAQLVVDVALDGDKAAVAVAGASSGCAIDGSQVTCTIEVAPRGTPTVTIVARPLFKGQLTFDVNEGVSGEDFGTVAVNVVPAPRGGAPRR
jgi:hypothetical protein